MVADGEHGDASGGIAMTIVMMKHGDGDGEGDLTDFIGSQTAQQQHVGGPIYQAGKVNAADHL